jgi:uncharacterized membrane protein YfcA
MRGSRVTPLYSVNFLYSLSGFCVGMLVGMTGVGGGSLMTPILILLFGVHPETAVGTDLLYASATKSTGTAIHGLARSIEWRIVGRLALGSIPATAATIYLMSLLGPANPKTAALITSVLGVALFLTAVALVFRERIVRLYRARIGEFGGRQTVWFTVIMGGILGVLVTLSSIGAGALGVTALILLYPRLPMVRIVGSDIAHAVPLTLVAGLGHSIFGSFDWSLFTSLLAGSIPGIVIGSVIATKVPETLLRMVLATVLAVVATQLFLTG